jgi:hypothetical protein
MKAKPTPASSGRTTALCAERVERQMTLHYPVPPNLFSGLHQGLAGPSLEKCHQWLGRPLEYLHWQLPGHICASRPPLGSNGLSTEAGRVPRRLHLVFLTKLPQAPQSGCRRCHVGILGRHDMPHLGSQARPQTAKNYHRAAQHHNLTRLSEEAVGSVIILSNMRIATGGDRPVLTKGAMKSSKKGTES